MQVNELRNVLVVGSGVMGSSIAQVFACAGLGVSLVDVDQRQLDRAKGLIESGLNTLADLGKISRESIPSILSRITPSTDLAQVSDNAGFVIEAVPEIPWVKREVFSKLDRLCPPDTIITSNTSALDIFSIAEVNGPERVIIAHFFAPAHIIPLVEIVPGTRTSRETVSFTAALMEKLGKRPVIMKRYGPGFIVNRIQKAIGDTALEMMEQGLADPEEIDLAVKLSLGIRLPIVGVVQSLDFNGLDMILQSMRNDGKVNSVVEEKVRQRHFGVKTSRGIYDYQGRAEAEILKKRDELYLKMLEFLKEIRAFDPV